MAVREIWKPIPGFEGYEASDRGRIRSVDRWVTHNARGHVRFRRGKILRPYFRPGKYVTVALGLHGGTHSVHVLVARTFIGEPPEGCEVAHNNNRKHDNRVSNLRWDTGLGNAADRLIHGTDARGEKCPTARLTLRQVRTIKRSKLMGIELAEKYGVSAAHICNIRKGVRWGWS